MTQVRLTIAIPCYGQVENVARLLVSLRDCPGHEILVLDDGNSEPLRVPSGDQRVRVIRHEQNRGLAAARNTLVREACGDVLVFFDADVTLENWSDVIAAAFVADDRLAAVTGRAFEDGGGGAPNRWRRWFWIQDHGPRSMDVPYAYGLCCVWRREVVLSLGGFDERMRTHGEDIDLSFRAAGRGWRLAHDAQFVVTHHRRDSIQSLLRMVWNHSRYFSLVCRRHGHPLYLQALVNALKWLPITFFSSVWRHRDAGLAAISLPAGLLSIWARLWALATPLPADERAGEEGGTGDGETGRQGQRRKAPADG